MTTSERLKALDEEYAQKKTNVLREGAIEETLPERVRGLKYFIHFHKLYGRECSINFEHDYFAYGREAKQPDLSHVVALAEKFPALPMVKVKDSCLSFRPQSYVNSLPESDKERWQEEIPVSPFLVKLETFQHQTVEIEWTAIVAGFLTEISIKIPLHELRIGTLDLRIKDIKGGRVVERCEFRPCDELHAIQREGETLAQLESPIKWARGSADTPNSFTLYFVDLRPETPSTVLDLCTALGDIVYKTKGPL